MNSTSRRTIRLWGPWQVKWLSSETSGIEAEQRINFRNAADAQSFAGADCLADSGQIVLARRFNCPTPTNVSICGEEWFSIANWS